MRASALTLPGNPFDVVTSGDGTSSFVSLNSSIAVLSDPSFLPRFISEIPIPGHPLGETLTHNGRYLLVADQSGAGVIKVAAAERGEANALLGVLRAPTQGSDGGAVEVTVSADDRYAFVTREAADDLAVFDLHRALLGGFAGGYFVGSVPLERRRRVSRSLPEVAGCTPRANRGRSR